MTEIPRPSDAELRAARHMLDSLDREIHVLSDDGMSNRQIIVSLVMRAVKLAATTYCLTPGELRMMFNKIMEEYSGIAEKEE